MFKKLALATAGLAAGLTLLAPSPAFAYSDTGPQYREVKPGQTVCVPSRSYAYASAEGRLAVTSGHAVRVTFGTFTKAFTDTVGPVSYTNPRLSIQLHPKAFPGYLQLCAINQSLKTSFVTMQVITD